MCRRVKKEGGERYVDITMRDDAGDVKNKQLQDTKQKDYALLMENMVEKVKQIHMVHRLAENFDLNRWSTHTMNGFHYLLGFTDCSHILDEASNQGHCG